MTNYRFTHTETTTDAAAETFWALWSDVSRWAEWDASLVSVTLEGDFVVGSAGTMVIEGQPPIPFRLTEVLPGRGFTDETEIPGALLRFKHEAVTVDGVTSVTYTVEVDGEIAAELGPAVTEDTPDSMRALVKLASSRA